jgi:HAD superfamily hydrolase (TIGR01509 family)
MAAMTWEAVLFDCDGVLVDSEAITCGALRDMLSASGWSMSLAECMARFVGKTVRSENALIEAHTGQPLTGAWMAAFYAERDRRLLQRVQAVAGAHALVQAAVAMTQGRVAVCSGADKGKLLMMLAHVDLLQPFGDHVYSGHDLPRSKPHPDVYWAGAAALGVAPERCLVIEDTATGVAAGVAAGATVWGFTGLHQQSLLAHGVQREFDSLVAMAQALGGA